MDTFRIYMERARLNTPLKRALEEDGRRQSWLAERLGTDARQVWGWVHGLHVPGDETKQRIAAALGRDVEALFGPATDEEVAA